MHIALIAAVADNGVIGIDNRLPWHLPQDLKHFKRLTLGKPVIMGRLTFDSIGKPLPGRTNIVLSRQADFQPDGVRVARDWDEALAIARQQAETDGVDEVMVMGGARLYEQALPKADRFYLTRVHLLPDGDARFPDWQDGSWQLQSSEAHTAEGESPAHAFEVWWR